MTIASSDNSGGAGIQQDIKVAHDLGYWALSAVTGLTVQNFREVFRVDPVNPDLLHSQITQNIGSFPVKAIKIGAVCSKENISVIARCLEKNHINNIVLDPVLFSTSGKVFLQKEAIEELKIKLFPLADLITPNKPEFEILTNTKINTIEEGMEIAKSKCREWNTSILLKGGHFRNKSITEALITKTTLYRFERERKIFTYEHGTGCTLSSALACNLGEGHSLTEAYKRSSEYLVKYYNSMGRTE